MRSKLFILVPILLLLLTTTVLAQQINMQPFTTEDETFRFEYPEGWSVEIIQGYQKSNVHLSVDNLPLDERFESPEGLNLQIFLPKKFYEMAFVSGETPSEVVSQLAHIPSQQATIDFVTPAPGATPQPLQLQPTSPDITEFSVNDRPAAFAYKIIQVLGQDASQLIIVADLGEDYWVSIAASSYKGGLETIQHNEPIILQIVQSMTYTALPPVYSDNPNLPKVYSGAVGIWQRGSVQFFYPEDWYVSNEMMLLFSNKQKNLFNSAPESGQFVAVVQGVSETIASVDQTELSNMCNTRSHNWTARELVTQLLASITPAQLEQLNNQGITTTQPEIITINDVEMVYVRQFQNDLETLSLFIDLADGNVMSMTVLAKKGELAQFEDQLFAVASTFEYTPNACDEDGP